MENNNKDKNGKGTIFKIPKNIQNLIDTAQSSIERLYQNTHMTSYTNNNDIEVIKNKMNDAINNISTRNLDITGNSSLSMLLRNNVDMKDRLLGDNGSMSNQAQDIEEMFNDKQFTDNFTVMLDDNKAIQQYDEEIDIILKYFPLLKESLDLKKDMVLSADNNTKDYLHYQSETAQNQDLFNNRIKALKKNYKWLEENENIYDKIATYGEVFYYMVPYNKAFAKLLNNRKGQGLTYANEAVYSNNDMVNGIIESTVSIKSEGVSITRKDKKQTFSYNENDMKDLTDSNFSSFGLQLNTTGLLENVIDEYSNTAKFKLKLQNHILSDDQLSKSKDIFVAPDGLLDKDKLQKKDRFNEHDFHVNGCIIKELKRENVIPIYVDNMCLGYYYIECEFDTFFSRKGSFSNMTGKNRNLMQENNKKEKRDMMINKLSGILSKHIDVSFINNHQDIKDQLYMILNHNIINNEKKLTNIKVTYLPPSDVEHLYFELDKETHRGISDLQNALVPAKLYISILMNTALGILTRSYDKRVYYVKQTVDTNISATIQNVLNQIKKGNFGTREMASIKNILGVTGRFSDYIIPMTAGGESPIQMEVMNGQQIDPQQELLQKLEQQAIEATDMVYEFVQSGKMVDFAIRLTMANGKMLRKSFRRQSQVEEYGSRMMSKLYAYEYGEEENIEMILPPPTLLTINNMNNILQNVQQTVESILQMEISDNDDAELRRIMNKKLMRYHLSTYLDISVIDKIKEESINEFKAKQKPEQ